MENFIFCAVQDFSFSSNLLKLITIRCLCQIRIQHLQIDLCTHFQDLQIDLCTHFQHLQIDLSKHFQVNLMRI